MTLSRPQPRDLVHCRDIRCRGYRRRDGLWDIEATLEDTKAYSFENRDRQGIASGEAIHAMRMRLTVDDALVVHAVEAATEAAPFDLCGGVTPKFAGLAGLRIGAGWRRAVLNRMGGVHGCTHLTELLLGPLTTTALQTVAAARRRREQAADSGGRPALIDSCHALAADGPIVAREWPAHYTGTAAETGDGD